MNNTYSILKVNRQIVKPKYVKQSLNPNLGGLFRGSFGGGGKVEFDT